MKLKAAFLTVFSTLCSLMVLSQDFNPNLDNNADSTALSVDSIVSVDSMWVKQGYNYEESDPEPFYYASVTDSLLIEFCAPDTVMSLKPLPRKFFLPAVFSTYRSDDTLSIFTPEYSDNPALRWAEDAAALDRRSNRILQKMVIANPSSMPYNVQFLPESPKQWVVEINPDENTIVIRDLGTSTKVDNTTLTPVIVKKRHWMRKFTASLQFSQAYISPNWYQGGNNNLNALLNLYYNVKLNQKYHPKLLFESTFQYRLGMNNAPDDSLRNYNISQDILQINTVFGVKALKKWYYSLTGQFKTQVFNNYPTNSRTLKAAFLSPGALTLGLGITYNTSTPKYTFDASISPLSYNLDICTSNRVNPTTYGIEQGKHFKNSFGSSVECKLAWKIAYNISLSSRLFAFTDYSSAYSDWENTFTFEINRFLTAQLFIHFRYDSETPKRDDYGHWKKLQMKEILSLGFSYAFSTI